MKITFKKHPKETGLSAVGHPHPSVDIKVDGKVCGIIHPPSWRTPDSTWKVSLAVYDQDENGEWSWSGTWGWVHLKAKFDSENEARNYVKENLASIVENGPFLHFFDD